jgi:hypothetical protein
VQKDYKNGNLFSYNPYVRFPSDWAISKTYYPLLKKEFPKIVLSADVFWLVTRSDLFWIWQNLESFLLHFDYIWPMVYPSHYWKWTLWFEIADNHPYEIIKNALSFTNKRIDELNISIKNAKINNQKLKIKNAFFTEKDLENVDIIPKNKIRPWIQWFSCTRCKWATPYNGIKFKKQIQAINDSGLDSRWVWNSASNYYLDWYDKVSK